MTIAEVTDRTWRRAALNGAGTSTSDECGYAFRVLPRAILRGLRDAVHGDGSGGLRGAAIIADLGMAVAGFAVGGASAALGRTARAVRRPRTPRTAAEVSR
jgi:hypothetical protein